MTVYVNEQYALFLHLHPDITVYLLEKVQWLLTAPGFLLKVLYVTLIVLKHKYTIMFTDTYFSK